MKPKSAEYDIGKDAHGRPVTLIVKRESADKDSWSIRIDTINQLDDKREITCLTEENLLAIAEVVMPSSFVPTYRPPFVPGIDRVTV